MIDEIFKWYVTPNSDDIDHLNHVNNASYLKWIQAGVTAQWQSRATPLMLTQYLWMATRHEIDYRQQSFLDDSLCVDVILRKVRGVRAYYDMIIKRGDGIVVEAKSVWCCISASSLKPVRIGQDIIRACSATG